MNTSRRAPLDIVLPLVPALLVVALVVTLRTFRLDDAFITYRVARNIATGVGFVYNPGEYVLSVTNPLYTLLLAAVYFITPRLPLAGLLLGGAGIAASAGLLVVLFRPAGRVPALSAGLFAAGFPLLYLTLGLETPIQIALGLLAVCFYLRGRMAPAALTLSLAALVRPDMVLLAGVLAAHHALRHLLHRQRIPVPVGALLAYALPLLAWAAYGWATFGSPLPVTLGAKGAQAALGVTGFQSGTSFIGALGLLARALPVLSPLWVPLAVIPLLGLWKLAAVSLAKGRKDRVEQGPEEVPHAAFLLIAWALLHLLGYVLLGVVPYRWYFAPLVPALAALFALGVEFILLQPVPRWRYALAALTLALLGASSGGTLARVALTGQRGEEYLGPHARALLPVVDWDIYYEAGTWLRENTPPASSVGVAEIGQPGYWAERPMVDYLGLLQPDIARALARRDVFWWLPHYTPDYLLISEAEGRAALFGYVLEGDPWFEASYQQVTRFTDPRYDRSPLVVYRRVVAPPAITPLAIPPADLPLPLLSLAADAPLSDLPAGQPLRVRLEWELAAPRAEQRHIALRIATPDQSTVAARHNRTFDVSAWPVAERLTTYHPVVLADELPPGVYHIDVGVGPAPGDLRWATVARARVPLPPPPDDQTLTGERVTFGPIALSGWRVAVGEGALDVRLGWQAVDAPSRDYTVFVHVLDEAGSIVAQTDRQPHFGTYPTGVWTPGERVVDTYHVDLAGVPPGTYEVHVGLYIPGEAALSTAAGEGSALIDTITLP